MPVLQHVALSNKHINHPAMGPYQLLEYEPHDVGGFEAAKAAWLMAVGRGEWNLADHLFLSLWQTAPAIQVFDLLMSVAIPKNWNDDHYFMFPGAMWRAFETGVLDKAYLPLLMRPVVRYVTRSPVLPLNPVPNPMPEIEGADRKARAPDPHPAAAQRATTKPRRSARSARRSARSRSMPRSRR